jgi:hypothetical protein
MAFSVIVLLRMRMKLFSGVMLNNSLYIVIPFFSLLSLTVVIKGESHNLAYSLRFESISEKV